MSDAEQAKRAKQHDLQETPRQRAKRLIRADIRKQNGLKERYQQLRNRLLYHGRFLSAEDQGELVGYLEREFEATRLLVEGVGEPAEFGFSSDLLDELED